MNEGVANKLDGGPSDRVQAGSVVISIYPAPATILVHAATIKGAEPAADAAPFTRRFTLLLSAPW